MSIQLTWDDLIIQNISSIESEQWLSEWKWLVFGQFFPLFITIFGDWFLRRPDGATEQLDVLEGSLKKVCDTPEEFDQLVNIIEWQEENLLSWLVLQMHEENQIPGKGQCYGFAPHPTFTGTIDKKHVVILDIIVWQTICSQTFNQR